VSRKQEAGSRKQEVGSGKTSHRRPCQPLDARHSRAPADPPPKVPSAAIGPGGPWPWKVRVPTDGPTFPRQEAAIRPAKRSQRGKLSVICRKTTSHDRAKSKFKQTHAPKAHTNGRASRPPCSSTPFSCVPKGSPSPCAADEASLLLPQHRAAECATSHQPPATSHQPPATSHQPPATSPRPQAGH